jgi:hypothetical protein
VVERKIISVKVWNVCVWGWVGWWVEVGQNGPFRM